MHSSRDFRALASEVIRMARERLPGNEQGIISPPHIEPQASAGLRIPSYLSGGFIRQPEPIDFSRYFDGLGIKEYFDLYRRDSK
jgi:hypothetical protein